MTGAGASDGKPPVQLRIGAGPTRRLMRSGNLLQVLSNSSGRPAAGLHALRAADGTDTLRTDRREAIASPRPRVPASLTYVLGMAVTYTRPASPLPRRANRCRRFPAALDHRALRGAVRRDGMSDVRPVYTVQMPSFVQSRLAQISNRQRSGISSASGSWACSRR